MIKYKIDVLQALKEKGYTTYKLRQNNIIGQRTISDYKHNNVVGSVKNISLLCKLLDMQPGELLEYIPDDNGTWHTKTEKALTNMSRSFFVFLYAAYTSIYIYRHIDTHIIYVV